MRTATALALITITALLTLPGLAQDRSLKDDGRVGTVVKVEGAAFVRPAAAERWTRVRPRTVLFPGDTVRVLPDGPNALSLSLGSGRSLVLGPGTRVGLPETGKPRLLHGEVEARGGADHVLILTGPRGFEAMVRTVAMFRVTDGGVTPLSEPPPWLRGYRSSRPSEWMGSLLAKVDGRDVPLAIRSHEVDVVVRDQIARTRVDQAFVNGTDTVLEGVFTFPLPAGASISGFGMWIGGELVMADIVERQRARRIYEDIKRRKKDPGLLEWDGGNLFTARVFPIPAHATKRIRIEYTQVLPLEGDAYRYRYALRSEMLRARPLDRLSIRVSVASAVPIAEVSSPTHEVQVERSEHTARVTFDADGYAPDRDFEAVVRLARTAPLAAVPHVRGDDGYFLLLLAPPDPEAAGWRRDILPDGESLDLLLIADTSGSMDEAARDVQRRFLAALLASLSEKDTFRLMAADVAPVWWKSEPGPASERNARAALGFLAARASAGWSALEKTLGVAVEAAGTGTQVIYVGDGIPTDGDPDASLAAARIARLGRDSPAVFHAVSAGSTYEAPVLSAIASIGGGSVRAADGDPVEAAQALLREIARPAVKDLAVRIDGIRTARVYPEQPPNLAAGKQQILLGRFFVTGERQEGEVVVTGTRDGKPVRFTAPLTIDEADGAGNSFLPRLWARRHLDALLAEGRTPQVVSDVIALSEEFGIITPYTSFLVLESDEDRERYGVKRRVRMRDGELLFAEARNAAATETLRAQMRSAGAARAKLRAAMLSELIRLAPGRSDRGLSAGGGHWGGAIEDPVIRDAKVSDHNEVDNDMPFEESLGGSDFISDAPFDGPLIAKGGGDFADEHGISWERELSHLPKLEMKLDIPVLGDVPVLGRLFRGSRPLEGRLFRRFPNVSAPREPDRPAPAVVWPEGVEDALMRIDRRPALAALEGGLEVRARAERRHRLRSEVQDAGSTWALVGKDRWLAARGLPDGGVRDEWCVFGERGVVDYTVLLGSTRPAAAGDEQAWRHVPGLVTEDFRRALAGFTARIERENGKTTLTFRNDGSAEVEVTLVIDEGRGVLLSHRRVENGVEQFRTNYDEFVGAAGALWPTRVVTTERWWTETVLRDVAELSPSDLDTKIATRRSDHVQALVVAPLPTLADARQVRYEGKGTFADHLVVASAELGRSRREEARAAFDDAAKLVGDREGIIYLQADVHDRTRTGVARVEDARNAAELAFATKSLRNRVARMQIALRLARALPALDRLELLARFRDGLPRDAVARSLRIELGWDLVRLLLAADREEEAFALLAELGRPIDPDGWRQALYRFGELGEEEMFDRLVGEMPLKQGWWTPVETDRAFTLVLGDLEKRRELDRCLATAKVWAEHRPDSPSAHRRVLDALARLFRIEERDALLATWLEGGYGDAGSEQRARCAAAFETVRRWSDPRWIPALVRIARQAGRTGDRLAGRIQDSLPEERADEVRRALLDELTAEGGIEDAPIHQLRARLSLHGWALVEDADRLKVVDGLKARLASAATDDARFALLELTLDLLRNGSSDAEEIALLREFISYPGENGPRRAAWRLAEMLARAPWSEDGAKEALALLPRTRGSGSPQMERYSLLGRTGDLAHALVRARRTAALFPREEFEKLTGADRKQALAEARRIAYLDVGRLYLAAAEEAGEELRPFLRLEGAVMLTLAGEPSGPLAETARALVLRPVPPDAPSILAGPRVRARAAHLLSHLAVRYDEVDGDAVLGLFSEMEEVDEDHDWRRETFRLLVALDRPDEIEAKLRAWIVPGQVGSRWRIALAFFLAETGRIADAVPFLEAAAARDELTSDGYGALADFYLVLGEDERRERALTKRYLHKSTRDLMRRLPASSRATASPAPIDEETLRLLRTLLAKASPATSRIRDVTRLYRSRKDPRLLAALADGLPGQGVTRSYGYLDATRAAVAKVHEEATLDVLASRTRELLEDTKDPLDRRTLHLLLAIVERRAADVANAPAPHVAAAVTALTAAGEGPLLSGEASQFQRTIAGLGVIPRADLAAAQLTLLARTAGSGEAGTVESLALAAALAETLWSYGRRDEATDRLSAALDARRVAPSRPLPRSAFGRASLLTGWLEAAGRYGRAERFLLAEIERQPTLGRRRPYENRLLTLYANCFTAGGTVTLGSGLEIWPEVLDRIETVVRKRPGELSRLTKFHEAIAAKNADARADLLRFAMEDYPGLELRFAKRSTAAALVSRALVAAIGPKAALEFLVDCLSRPTGHEVWSRNGRTLAELRRDAGDIGDLEPRLLTAVLEGLSRDLPRGRAGRSLLCSRQSEWFWEEKAEDFAKNAHRVLAESADPDAVRYRVAAYLSEDLGRHEEAIDVLTAAQAAGSLNARQRLLLANLYVTVSRETEALPHLVLLMVDHPDDLSYRIRTIEVLHMLGRNEEGKGVADNAEKHLRARSKWRESTARNLGAACLAAKHYDRAARLLGEALELRRKRRGSRGMLFSRMATRLAEARIGAGDTAGAVEAAAEAIVAARSGGWRTQALLMLQTALESAADLDGYTARHDAEVAKTGLDSPVIRLGLGIARRKREEPEKAIRELLLARELSPMDRKVSEELIASYDLANDLEGGCRAKAELVRRFPRDFDLYEDLALRHLRFGRVDEAKRVRTGLVEAAPLEAESHRRLASWFVRTGREEQAVLQLEIATRLRSFDAGLWVALADALLAAERTEDAIRVLRKVIDTRWDPENLRAVERAKKLLALQR